MITAVFITAGTFAQTLSFKLKEAQDFAVQNSYKVKNAQFDLEMARKQVKENLSYGLPQINASGIMTIILLCPLR